jgi:hypothetical protein
MYTMPLIQKDAEIDSRELKTVISYEGFESLTEMYHHNPEILLGARVGYPISIVYMHPPVREPGRTLQKVQETYEKIHQEWERSEQYVMLQRLFNEQQFPFPVRKIVGFGLGYVSVKDDRSNDACYVQHAALLMMAKTLEARFGNPVQCYVQDPAYDDIQIEFLQSLNIKVVDDPQGFLEINDSTLLFSVSPNVPVKQIVADIGWPTAMLWDTVEAIKHDEWKEEVVGDNDDVCWIAYVVSPSPMFVVCVRVCAN